MATVFEVAQTLEHPLEETSIIEITVLAAWFLATRYALFGVPRAGADIFWSRYAHI
jgi:hypothetical protein